MWGKNRAVFLFPFLVLFGCFDLAIKAMVNIGKYRWMRVTPATGWKNISYEFLKRTGTQTHGNCSEIALIWEDSSPRIRCPQLSRWLQPSIRSHKDALRQLEMIFASINHLHLSWPAALTHISSAKVPGTAPWCPFKMA